VGLGLVRLGSEQVILGRVAGGDLHRERRSDSCSQEITMTRIIEVVVDALVRYLLPKILDRFSKAWGKLQRKLRKRQLRRLSKSMRDPHGHSAETVSQQRNHHDD
jgi:hypothetical protein